MLLELIITIGLVTIGGSLMFIAADIAKIARHFTKQEAENKWDGIFAGIKLHDRLRRDARMAILDAIEAQYNSSNDTNSEDILAAIHAEREAHAAAEKSELEDELYEQKLAAGRAAREARCSRG